MTTSDRDRAPAICPSCGEPDDTCECMMGSVAALRSQPQADESHSQPRATKLDDVAEAHDDDAPVVRQHARPPVAELVYDADDQLQRVLDDEADVLDDHLVAHLDDEDVLEL